MLDVAVWTVCAGDEGVLREAAAPLSDLLLASGLVCDGDWVARSGFDFGAWRVAGRCPSSSRLCTDRRNPCGNRAFASPIRPGSRGRAERAVGRPAVGGVLDGAL